MEGDDLLLRVYIVTQIALPRTICVAEILISPVLDMQSSVSSVACNSSPSCLWKPSCMAGYSCLLGVVMQARTSPGTTSS